MRNVCNVCMLHAMGDVISGIGIGIAVADSIGYRAPARYRSNPNYNTEWSRKIAQSLMHHNFAIVRNKLMLFTSKIDW